MEKSKIDMFIIVNAENFNPQDLLIIKEKLETMSDDQLFLIQSADYQKPSFILMIAILLGWERFWLGEIGLGLLKILTCYGCFIWWFVDIFTAKARAKEYNFMKFKQITSYL